MPSVSSEIMADITDHIGKFGGDFTAWCVGTARDWHSADLEAHEHEEKNDDFICREAYTPASARSARLHFVNDCGSAQGSGEASDDGKLVYAFKISPARSGS
jgi:hypothetical protein